jgi:hypothetical protein
LLVLLDEAGRAKPSGDVQGKKNKVQAWRRTLNCSAGGQTTCRPPEQALVTLRFYYITNC